MRKYCDVCGAITSKTHGICPVCVGKPQFTKNGKINIKALKKKAKELVAGNFWRLLKPILIILFITVLENLLLINHEDNFTYCMVIQIIFSIIYLPISVGICSYYLNFIRGKEVSIKDLFNYYNKLIKIFLIYFLIILLSSLFALLFIIPGVIVFITYALALYILSDNQDMKILDIINRSKFMMKYHKAEYFVFILSFIGWFVLIILTLGIALIYVLPYMYTSEALYYDELRKLKKIG